MRSYQMSAAHNQQKTTIFKHFQISDKSRSPDDEGWQWIDGPNAHLPDPCREGKVSSQQLQCCTEPNAWILPGYKCTQLSRHWHQWAAILTNSALLPSLWTKLLQQSLCLVKVPDQLWHCTTPQWFVTSFLLASDYACIVTGNILECDQALYEDPPHDLLEAQVFDNAICLGERRQAWMLCQVLYDATRAELQGCLCGRFSTHWMICWWTSRHRSVARRGTTRHERQSTPLHHGLASKTIRMRVARRDHNN